MKLNSKIPTTGRPMRALRGVQTPLLAATVMAGIAGALPRAAQAATFTVVNTDDNGAGSLRQAILSANAANDADTIVFDAATFGSAQTIDLASGLTITNPTTITGTGARLLTVRRNNTDAFAILTINNGSGTVRISGMTISNGGAVGGPILFGAGVTNNGGTITLDGVTVSDTVAGADAAVDNVSGTMTIINSLISNNTSIGLLMEGGTVNVSNSTISGNSDPNGIGAVAVSTDNTINLNNVTIANNQPIGLNNTDAGTFTGVGTFNIRNTIIAGNQMDIKGGFVSQGYNLVGSTTGGTGFGATGDKTNVAANLGALANNSGQTDTHRLNTGSPALNAGDPNFNGAGLFDQRGTPFERVSGGRLDIGAFELVQAPNTAPDFPAASYTAGLNDPLSIQLTATDAENDPLTYSSANVPAGLTLSTTGLLTGTPAAIGNFLFQVTVNDGAEDGKGGTATANIFIAVRDLPAGSDSLGPILTHNALPKTMTRAQLADFVVSGRVRDVAPGTITPVGVRRVLVNLRTGDNKRAYDGSAFTTNLNRGYYIATQSESTADTTETLTYTRALAFVPTNLTAGPYILVLYPQDLAGNYSAEFLQFTVTAPAAPTRSSDVNSGGGS